MKYYNEIAFFASVLLDVQIIAPQSFQRRQFLSCEDFLGKECVTQRKLTKIKSLIWWGRKTESSLLVSWQKILEEQRRLKREQEEADTASRRHTGTVPTHHQFITNERFGDLLNITDNAEKRKSGIEVHYRTVLCPSLIRKINDRCYVSLCEGLVAGVKGGGFSGVSTCTDGFLFCVKTSWGWSSEMLVNAFTVYVLSTIFFTTHPD